MKKIEITVSLEVDEQAWCYVYECGPRELHASVETYVRDAIVDTLPAHQGDLVVKSCRTVWS